jgi:hypothetical protein
MNKNNYIFYAIIIYIIIISILIITKPDCIYDHNNSRFKQFGYTKDKTMFPIGILSIFIAVIIIILFSFLGADNNNNNNSDISLEEKKILQKYQYMMGGNIQNMMTPIYQQQLYPQQIIQPYMRTTIAEHAIPNIIYQQIQPMQVPQMQQMQIQPVQLPQMQQMQIQPVPVSQIQPVPVSQIQPVQQ